MSEPKQGEWHMRDGIGGRQLRCDAAVKNSFETVGEVVGQIAHYRLMWSELNQTQGVLLLRRAAAKMVEVYEGALRRWSLSTGRTEAVSGTHRATIHPTHIEVVNIRTGIPVTWLGPRRLEAV